jgi:hypothetical protein
MQIGQRAVGCAVRELLVNVATMEGEELEVPRRLQIALAGSMTAWLEGLAPDGIDPTLDAVTAADVEVAAHWAAWVRTELMAAPYLRAALADEIDGAIASVLDTAH